MRSLALAAPLLLLVYGVLRWIDGRNGVRKDGLAWDAGHVAFLLSVLLFALLAVLLAGRTARGRRLAPVAATAAVAGAGCMVWVIAGDLSASFRDRWPRPEPLQVAGPLLFVLGLVVLLGLQVAAGRVPVWSPVLFFLGYAAITVNLDLLPFAALLILAATALLRNSRQLTVASKPI